MKGRLGNIVIAIIFFMFPLSLLLMGQFVWEYRTNVILFPWMAGALVMLSTLWLLARAFIVPVDVLEKEGESIGLSDDPRSSLVKRLLWMACVYPVCYILGLLMGLMFFTLAYTSYHRLPWWQRILSVSIVFIIVYVGFYTLLGVSLPIEPLWIR